MTSFDPEQARATLRRDGVVHLEAVLDPEAVVSARASLDRLFDAISSLPAKYVTSYADTTEGACGSIEEINHCLRQSKRLRDEPLVTGLRKIANALIGRKTRASFDHAIYKSGDSGRVSWHQDQAYKRSVERMRSIALWVPLQDVPEQMGAMCYVPTRRIHDLQVHRRHVDTGTLRTEAPPEGWVVTHEVELGDVLVHTPLTLHSSLPNRSDTRRKAWIVHFGPYGRLEPFMPGNLGHLMRHLSTRAQSAFDARWRGSRRQLDDRLD